MYKIIPHLWYDKKALEASKWYVSMFENSSINKVITIPDTPSGDCDFIDFKLANLDLLAISAGPYFNFNPSISLMVSCSTGEEVDRLYGILSAGGSDLMPLDEYPFSKRYAWVQDKYGLSWQLMYTENMQEKHHIRISLLFSGEACGKAEAALDYYTEVFEDSKKGYVNYYASGEAADPRARINYSEAKVRGLELVAMDHGYGEDFTFNEAISFVVLCEDQGQIDHYWDKLSFDPEAEQCGWLRDQFGVSWQIEPVFLHDIMMHGTKEEVKRITEAFLKMKKFDIQTLKEAYENK
jgi:predicted 3-demethylubiquinone-9 3-methyltransferase (glyoxalase superfamily)